jgi:hypothetical protein
MFFQLLEAIGAISKADSKKEKSRGGNYQDNAAPVDHEFDDEAVQQEDEEEEDESSVVRPDGVLSAISKVVSLFSVHRASGV